MTGSHGLMVVTMAVVGLLCVLLLAEFWPHRSMPSTAPSRPAVPSRSPSEAALMESRQHWIQAWNAVGQAQSRREAWDLAAAEPDSSRPWEQTEIARRPELSLARQSAQQAVKLAQSQPETYQSVRWLSRIECALGHHREELRLAQRLASLAPGDEGALTCLLQAAKCNGLRELEHQARAALKRPDPSRAAR